MEAGREEELAEAAARELADLLAVRAHLRGTQHRVDAARLRVAVVLV